MMNNFMEYKGIFGTVEYSDKDKVLFGKALGVNGLVSYEGQSVAELRADFEAAVDEYLEMCKETGVFPEKVYKGSLNVRLNPELHKKASIAAGVKNISLNKYIEAAVEGSVFADYNS